MVSRQIPHVRAPIVTSTGSPTKVFYDLLDRLVIASDSSDLAAVFNQIQLPSSEMAALEAAALEDRVDALVLEDVVRTSGVGVADDVLERLELLEQAVCECRGVRDDSEADDRLEVLEQLARMSPAAFAALAELLDRVEDLEVLGSLQKTAFNEVQTAELTPTVQVVFPYNINTEQVTKYATGSGAVTWASNMASVQSGAAASSAGILRSRETVRYGAGMGLLARFTAVFDTGAANNEQIIGPGNSSDGFFFGYNGTSFGVLHRKGGEMEIRTLTITTASSTTENITITLNGVAHSVPVTNSAVIPTTAREIAAFDYSASGWVARASGAKVIFSSLDSVATLTGSYTLSGATTAVGAFAQTVAGVAPTDSWVAQASWSEGVPPGVTFDWTKGNVFQIQIQYLGFGQISFCVEDPSTGMFHCVHKIKYANANTAPSFSNPTLFMYARSKNSSNTTNITLKTASLAMFVEGSDPGIGPHFARSRAYAIGNTTDEKHVMTIRNKEVFQSRTNRTNVQIRAFTFATALSSSSALATFRFYVGATPLTSVSYADNSTDTSIVEYDVAATTFSTTSATLAYEMTIGTSTSFAAAAEKLVDRLSPGETLMVTCQTTAGHANNVVAVSLNWAELF